MFLHLVVNVILIQWNRLVELAFFIYIDVSCSMGVNKEYTNDCRLLFVYLALYKYLIYNKTLHCIIAHSSSKNQLYIHFNALCPLFMSSLMESSRIVKTDW